MSTLKTTYIQHVNSVSPQISLSASGIFFSSSATYGITAPSGTNTTQIATTGFSFAAASSASANADIRALSYASSASALVSPFQTYTPTFTGITVGNGTTVARYVQIGKFVYGYISFTLGSTSSVTGSVTMTTPTTMDFATSDTFISSHVLMRDIGVVDAVGHATTPSTTTFTVLAQLVSGTYNVQALVSSTVPFTWGNGDKFVVTFAYHSV